MLKKGDVITVISVAGEYVGKYESESPQNLVIKDPKMLVNGDNGLGFAKGICVTGREDPNEMKFYVGGIVFVTETTDAVVKAYHEANSGLIL